MKLGVLLVLSAVSPMTLAAQTWTQDESSLIEAIEYCWDRAAGEMSPQAMAEACRPTTATVYWWTPETAPHDVVSPWSDQLMESWNRELVAQDLRPVRVLIDGNFGFIHFHGIRIWQSSDGTRETESWKGFEVWKRTPEGWAFFAGTGTPDMLNQTG